MTKIAIGTKKETEKQVFELVEFLVSPKNQKFEIKFELKILVNQRFKVIKYFIKNPDGDFFAVDRGGKSHLINPDDLRLTIIRNYILN